MQLFFIIAGGALLLFGKKLFWVALGLAGFAVGMTLSQELVPEAPITVALVVGVVFAVLAVIAARLLKNIAFGAGGFVLGAYLCSSMLDLFQLDIGLLSWVVIIVGGILGAVLLLVLFNWALILLSSLMGALLIVQSIPERFEALPIIFCALVVLGVVVQFRGGVRNNPKTPIVIQQVVEE
jgi:hypothetical protein